VTTLGKEMELNLSAKTEERRGNDCPDFLKGIKKAKGPPGKKEMNSYNLIKNPLDGRDFGGVPKKGQVGRTWDISIRNSWFLVIRGKKRKILNQSRRGEVRQN